MHPAIDTRRSSNSAFSRRSSRTFAALGTVILGGALLGSGLASPAFGASACPVGSLPISAGSSTCEVAFTASGSWTPPTGVSKIEALLVGASGAATASYGGGGGDVRIVELAPSGAVTVVVGLGGVGSVAGGTSSVTQGVLVENAVGGDGGSDANIKGGDSGNGNLGDGGGAGAGGVSAPSFYDGGPGVVVSSLPSTFFTADTDCLGGGGSGRNFSGDTVATCGGGYYTALVENTGTGPYVANSGSVDQVLPVANSGGGASPLVSFNSTDLPAVFSPANGVDGQVVLRFTMAGLAATGAQESSSGGLIAGLLMLAGAGAIAVSRRRRTRLS